MPEDRLRHDLSETDLAMMKEIVALLVGRPSAEDYQVTASQFPKLVREMRMLYEQGSRSLGEAIIKASECIEVGHSENAISIYSVFINLSPSPFYKRIA